MFSSRLIWWSGFIMLASAMQKKLEQGNSVVKAKGLAKTFSNRSVDWERLNNAFQTDTMLHLESCESSEYQQFLESQATLLQSFQLSRLDIPANKRILFYGHSYLHQVLANILIGNEHSLIKKGPLGGFEGVNLAQDKWGYVTTWDFRMNTTILEIQNFATLQRAGSIDQLQAFMKNYQFDMAFFMNPHMDCYFLTWTGAPELCSSQQIIDDYTGDRSDANPFWNVIKEAVPQVYEVEAWGWQERTQWHATDFDHVIGSHEILRGRACDQDDACVTHENAMGHQCQPGTLLLVSEEVVKKMHS